MNRLDTLIIIKEIINDLDKVTNFSKFSILEKLIETKYYKYIQKCNRDEIAFLIS